MNTRYLIQTVIPLTVFLSCPMLASVEVYSLTVGEDCLAFASQPEAGYVVQSRPKTGGISILSSTLASSASEHARPICGPDRHGIWVIGDVRPAAENERVITRLRGEAQVTYAAPLFSCQGETVAIIPEIVVRVKPAVTLAELQDLCQAAGCRIKKPMEFTEQEYLLEVLGPDAESVFAAVETLGLSAALEWAYPNTASQPRLCGQSDSLGGYASPRHAQNAMAISGTSGVIPNDEYFTKQWHLHNTGQAGGTPGADIRAPEAWEITTGDPNIVIAVLDTGVDLAHPDLVNNLVPGYDFYNYDDIPEPSGAGNSDGHGTMCAGLIAAQGNNAIGVTGVTWNCRLMPLRAYVWGGWGITPESDLATALRWAAAHGADVLSNSWVDNIPLPIVHSAIVDVTKPGGMGRDGKGCVVLFCSGNWGTVYPPATYSEVIAVGATDKNDQIRSYSGKGPELDIVAPGGGIGSPPADIWTTDLVGLAGWNAGDPAILDYTDHFGGTSSACPIAAGVAALILSVEPNLTNDEVRHFLERSAKDLGDPGRDDYYGWGRIDARAALDMVLAKRADLNSDWKVDEQDLEILNVAIDTNDLSADIAPAAKRDGVVDANDLELLMQYLGTEIPEMTEPGLAAHWKLDEVEGVFASDSVGENDAVLHGEPTWQPESGMIGGALQLDGADDYVATGLIRDPSEGPFSIFTWVRGGELGQVLVSQTGGANWLKVAPTGALMTELKGSGRGDKPLSSQAVITDGNWHRVGLTWDGSNRVLYVDDVEVATDPQTALAGTYAGLHIGAGSKLDPGTFWSGLIDDVRVYDRAVTP